MPTEIEAPDGTIVEFPDGTSVSTMRRAMASRWPSKIRKPGQPMGYSDVGGVIANFGAGLTLNSNDEAGGVMGGAYDAASEALRGGNPAQGYQRGYEREAGRTRAYRDEFMRTRPLAAGAVAGIGAVAPILATAGQSIAPQTMSAATQRLAVENAIQRELARRAGQGGMAGGARQIAQGGALGATYGYGAGFAGNDEAPLEERGLAGQQGGLFGGLLGGGLAAGLSAGGAVLSRFRSPAVALAEQIPTPDPNSVGAFGRPMLPRQRRQPQGQTIAPSTLNTLDRVLDRRGFTADQFGEAAAQARANPQGQRVVDLLGDPGNRTLRSMAQGPGRTGQQATDAWTNRAHSAPERVLSELNRRMFSDRRAQGLPVAETPQQALTALQDQYSDVSAQVFEPLWQRPIAPEARAALMQNVEPFLDDPVFQDAARRGQEIFNRARRTRRVNGAMTDNLGRYLHFIKLGLDDAARGASSPAAAHGGAGPTEMAGIREMRRQFVGMLDDTIPGYRPARAEWGGIIEAEEALTEGAQMLNRNHRDVQAYMDGLTPFARYHARVGFANAVGNRVGLRDSVNGNRNIAEALGSTEMQNRVRAMFDSPDEAAAFLDTLNTQNRLVRNASQWTTGSQTFSNAAHAMDEGVAAMTEAGAQMSRGRPGASLGTGINWAWNQVRLGAVERRNNQVGADLLRPVDTEDSAAFTDEVVRLLRERQTERAFAAARARATGAYGGTSSATERERRYRQ